MINWLVGCVEKEGNELLCWRVPLNGLWLLPRLSLTEVGYSTMNEYIVFAGVDHLDLIGHQTETSRNWIDLNLGGLMINFKWLTFCVNWKWCSTLFFVPRMTLLESLRKKLAMVEVAMSPMFWRPQTPELIESMINQSLF